MWSHCWLPARFEAGDSLLYLFDANVFITASNAYYPIDQVPEFWEWLQFQGSAGNIKVPLEIMEEILAGNKDDDPLLAWIKDTANKQALLLDEIIDPDLVDKVVKSGYAEDLTDDELEEIGRDPFLIAYGLSGKDRCVVTTEISAPSKKRQNRRIPDVCTTFGLECCTPFRVNRELGFRTGWKV
jgi:hypothetical protein